jgi:hypothetical protein
VGVELRRGCGTGSFKNIKGFYELLIQIKLPVDHTREMLEKAVAKKQKTWYNMDNIF